MKNLIKNRIRVVKKNTIKEEREPIVIACGSRVSTITFPVRKDGRIKGGTRYHQDYSLPKVRDIRNTDDDSSLKSVARDH